MDTALVNDRWKKMPVTTIAMLRKHYDEKPIEELEDLASNATTAWFENGILFINMMFYLERTRRYKENKRFAKSTFEEYIRIRHGLQPKKYYRDRLAYVNYPQETKEYGVGFVEKVKRKCGVLNFPKVVKDIKKAEKNKEPLVQQEINEIIEKHSTEKPPADTLPAWVLRKENDALRLALIESEKVRKEQAIQIAKMKKTLKTLKEQSKDHAE